jgi:hypothetical protein
MTQQVIQVGAEPNDGQGTPLRNSFIITNSNFTELYARAQTTPPTTLVGNIGDQAGWYAYDNTYFYYCFKNYDGANIVWGKLEQGGNISATQLINGNSNVKITDINGNVTTGINGFGNVVTVATTGQYVRGVVSAIGNVTGSYILGNGSQLTGLNPLYNNSNVTQLLATFGSNNISTTGNISSGNVNSSAVYSTGNISATGNITTDSFFVGTFVGNVVATLTNIPGPGGAVVYNDGLGNAAATAGLIFNVSGPNTLTVQGTIFTNGNVSAAGNVISGNASVSGQASVGGNVTGGNFNTAGVLSATGNVRGGNVNTVGLVTATGNVTGGNLVTSGVVTAAGNVTGNYLRATLDINAGGNVSATAHTGTSVSVTGNVTGGNITTGGNVTGSNILTAGVMSSTGNATHGNILTGGIVSATGNITGGNIRTSGSISATGNITGGNVVLSDIGSLRIGNLFITDATIDSTEHNITIGSSGNVGNIIIAGNLQVLGNTTTINSNTVSTNDLTFNLANNAINSAAANGGGIEVGPVGTPFITWLYNNTANTWTTAGGISATGNLTAGNIATAGVITVNSGNAVTGIVNGAGNGIGNIGSSTTYFNTVFAKATSAQYADLAENYVADTEYTPGTVVVFGGDNEITISTDVADERVAGAISTNPAHLMNAAMPGLPVALRGRVPVNVIGPVVKGDSLVTSSTAGHAQSVGRSRLYGQAVFAKSLETNLEDGKKVIIAVII